jgi:hypothetical protein
LAAIAIMPSDLSEKLTTVEKVIFDTAAQRVFFCEISSIPAD